MIKVRINQLKVSMMILSMLKEI